ncbi:arginine--tRNA ligase [Alkalibaculum sporogenes]|uniref:arginine--tRNA ligase n=1 Tax=Alkalibaculum sporogenes TaxID=2655001 RepID=UPI0031B61C63
MNKIIASIKLAVNESITRSVDEGAFTIDHMPSIIIEVPRDTTHGEFSTNVAMQITRQAKKSPKLIGEVIIKNIDTNNSYIKSVELAGPGFINFHLNQNWLYEVLEDIYDLRGSYGSSDIGAGKKVNVEFISANPTGPMHMGNARGGAIGDGIASILQCAGYQVSREFYINDAGNQIEKFGQSLEARYLQLLGQNIEFPEDGYKGEDITEHMKNFIEEQHKEYIDEESDRRKKAFIEYALNLNLQKIKEDLNEYGIKYDVWFSESVLHCQNQVNAVIDELKNKGYAYEKEGAVWFKATEFGCEKDDVLVRNNGIPTYFAADIAYHLDKLRTREFDWSINVWGADHHGHVARLKGALEALGIEPDRLTIIIMQLVRLTRKGEISRMSKRSGKMVTLSDLIDEVGKDAARFFFNLRSPDSHLDFDLDLAMEQSNDNPVFYVQYAHARICSILRQLDVEVSFSQVTLTLLKEKEEILLIRKLADLPQEIIMAIEKLDPSKITKYALDLSSDFHSFYNACRVKLEDEELMKSRIILIQCTKQVIENCLGILGVSAPEIM